MRKPDAEPDAKGKKRLSQMSYTEIAKVCKTFIRRFDPDPRLQITQALTPFESAAISGQLLIFRPRLRGAHASENRLELANRRRSLSKSLTRSLTRFPQKPDAATAARP